METKHTPTSETRWFKSLDILKRQELADLYTQETGDSTNIVEGLNDQAVNWLNRQMLAHYRPDQTPQASVITNPNFWDCECAENYIHLKSTQPNCLICGRNHEDQPDSHQNEVEALCFPESDAPSLLAENKQLKEKFESEAVLLDEQIELTGKKNHEIERLESLNAELLEALRECDSLLDRSDVTYHLSQKGDMALRNNLVRKVRAAITKAEGRK